MTHLMEVLDFMLDDGWLDCGLNRKAKGQLYISRHGNVAGLE